ncbi:MAG: transketolase [Fimbriimonadaceae bacterium]
MIGQTTPNDQLMINALRCLSIDMVQAANSGHPGLPLGAAPMAYALFKNHIRFDPARPDWFNRDRFILSPGHGSALNYSLLNMFGYDLPLEELKKFRQLGSKTPGHPEVGMTHGVECTTGPLGQGFANGIGMAIASKWLSGRYGAIIDHMVYAIVSDGDLMEGVAIEAASLAGHLGLGNLIYLYDSNDISLDGPCEKSYTEDVNKKFEAMGWQVLSVSDGNDLEEINRAVDSAKSENSKPTLVVVKTVIGFGSPVAGSSKSHGAPLGADGVAITKRALEWPSEEAFYVPDGYGDIANEAKTRGVRMSEEWDERFAAFQSENPSLAAELTCLMNGELPSGWDEELNSLKWDDGNVASRDSGSLALNAIANNVPWVVGGAADLASSTKTQIKNSSDFNVNNQPEGRNVWFGVREHAMGAIVNGMALSGLLSFGSTFLVFSDYMRGSIRLAALSHLKSLFIFTHDSVFVGEDGPTHQPIEHVESLRLIPNLDVYRPADAYETRESYRAAISNKRAASMVLTRQGLPTMNNFEAVINAGVKKGGYVLNDSSSPQVIILATGSEVELALRAQSELEKQGIGSRVVSVPCRELFLSQPAEYREAVLTGNLPIVAVEAGVTQGWVGIGSQRSVAVGIDRFGESGPGDAVYAHLGMTVDHIVSTVKSVVHQS